MDKDFKFIDGKLVRVKPKAKKVEVKKEEKVEPKVEEKPPKVEIDTKTLEEKIIEEAMRRLGL